jgi:hypothetical protein
MAMAFPAGGRSVLEADDVDPYLSHEDEGERAME